mmetsp:Transcript_14857/g.47708  ORF Transcript_14857/g.47708 Transcript_14857/m.47708 type:complete len:207 (+) Transcript_14857:1164-1784(+)
MSPPTIAKCAADTTSCSFHAMKQPIEREAFLMTNCIQLWYSFGSVCTRKGTATFCASGAIMPEMEMPRAIVFANSMRSMPCTAIHDVISPPSAADNFSGSLTACAETASLRERSSFESMSPFSRCAASSCFLLSLTFAAHTACTSLPMSISAASVLSQPQTWNALTAEMEAVYPPPQKVSARPARVWIASLGSLWYSSNPRLPSLR